MPCSRNAVEGKPTMHRTHHFDTTARALSLPAPPFPQATSSSPPLGTAPSKCGTWSRRSAPAPSTRTTRTRCAAWFSRTRRWSPRPSTRPSRSGSDMRSVWSARASACATPNSRPAPAVWMTDGRPAVGGGPESAAAVPNRRRLARNIAECVRSVRVWGGGVRGGAGI